MITNDFYLTDNDIERFWKFVDIKYETDCWEYKGKKHKDGYGKFVLGTQQKYRQVMAHRVAWKIEYGDIPNGYVIGHICDNPPCCNPKHLFLGTQRDNVLDMGRKHRRGAARGEKQGSSKLKTDEVIKIRQMYRDHIPQTEMAKLFNVDTATINHVIKRRTWNHIKE